MLRSGLFVTRRVQKAILPSIAALFCLFTASFGGAQTAISPTTVNFGNVVVNQASSIKIVSLKNTQAIPLHISSLAVSGGAGFALAASTTCPNPGTLPAGQTCAIGLTLTPPSIGVQPPGTLTLTTDASNSPQTVALTGVGVAPVTLSPASVGFGTVVVNTTSAAKSVALKNNQSSPLTLNSVLIGGAFALDTSASSATTCPIAGGTLAAGQSCLIGLTFNPVAIGAAAGGQITVLDSAANSPQFAMLTGTGVPAVIFAPTGANFGNQVVNTTSAFKNIQLINNQAIALNLSSITVPAPFAIAPGTTTCAVGTPVPPRSSCLVSVIFTPSSLGAVPPSVLTINEDATPSSITASLGGTGIAAVSISQTNLNFGNAVVGQPVILAETLKNNQITPLAIASITGFAGDYTLDSSSTCPLAPLTVPATSSCTIAVRLNASATGPQTGTININHNAPGSPLAFNVSAVAVAPVLVTPNPIKFTSQFLGTTSPAKTITVANKQNIGLKISSIAIAGPNSSDFAVTSACPAAPTPLPAISSCTLAVTFSPSGTGTRSATLSLVDDALGSPQTIPLSGSGSAPVTVTPLSLTSFAANVGSTSPYQTIVVKNQDLLTPIHITSFQINGDFQQTSTTCPIAPASLAGGASCNLTVSFAPTIGGVRAGQVQVYDDAFTSPQVVNLSGMGNAPLTLTPGALTFSAQKLGTISPVKNIVLTNHENQSESFTLTPAGNFQATSNCASGVIAAHSTCTLSVNFAPSATATPGPLSGSLTVMHTAAVGSPLVVQLLGSASTTNPPAAVAVVSPGAGSPSATVMATITGNTWTHFSSASVITFVDTNSSAIPNAITATVPNPATTTANSISAQLAISASAIAGARNIKVTTPLAGGGTEVAQLHSAFIIASASNAHTISAVTPSFGKQGQTFNVDLTGVGTNFVGGTTYANFGDGIAINSLTVNSPTDAVANITISNTTPIGYRSITLVTGGEFATSGPQAFQIGPNSATLLSVSPSVAAQGQSLPVTLTASGTHFLQDATQVSISGGVIVGNVQVTSPTTAIAQLAVAQSATVGVQSVTVSTGGEIATLGSAFTVTGATPALLSVTPSTAIQGQTLNVVITGNSFTNFNQSNILANFGGNIVVNSLTVNSPHVVTANITVSQNANVGGVAANLVSGPAGATTEFPFSFTVTPSSAQIISVTPNSVPQGGQVTLAVVGLNTNWVQGTTKSAFYPSPFENIQVNKVTIVDATHANLDISVSTDTSVGTFAFYMATGGQIVNANISVYAQTPTLTVSPANSLPGTTLSVSFTGKFTHFGPTTLPVISGQGVTLSNFVITSPVGATATVTLTPTAALGLRTITFTTGGEIVSTYFNVTSNPASIVNVSPYHGPQSTTMNVTITGSNTHFAAGTTQVLFGPFVTVNSVTVNSATTLVANITTTYSNAGTPTPSPAGWQTVFVNTGTEQVISGFAVDGPGSPTIVSVTPSSAAQGATANVVITGSLTHWVQGQTQAILGAGVTVSNFVVTSPTTATATIAVSPTAPVGGNSVILMTGSEIVSGAGFTVTPNAALIASVLPAVQNCNGNIVNFCGGGSGPWVVAQLQTSTLNVVGVGTHWLQGETTFSFGGGVLIDQLTINSPTTATVQITVLSSSPVGFVPLTARTDGEVVTLQQAIDIEQGFATLLATTPNVAQQGVTLTVQVLGRFTHWQQGVTSAAYNADITVNSINVIDSSNLTASITVSPNAYVDYGSPCGHVITITTGSEQVTGIPGVFCVAKGPAQITSVSPNIGVQGSTETVTVTGSFSHFIAGVTTANFGPGINVGSVNVTSPTTAQVALAVTTAAPTGFATATMTTYGEVATQQFAFSVTPGVGTLNEALPNQAEQGVQNLDIHLVGQYTHFSAASTATFGAGITVNSISFTDSSDLMVNISIDPLSYAGGRSVTVTTPGVPCKYLIDTHNPCPPNSPPGSTGSEIVTASVFSIIPGPAIISNVAPATGNEGQEVVFNITGANTHWAQNFTQFWIPGAGSDITINSVVINSPTSATVDMSIAEAANPGARSVYMVTAGESLVDSGAFVVTGGVPVITYLSPNNATPGTSQLQVTIHGIYTQWTQANTTVSFGPGVTVSSYVVGNNTTIQAVINVDPAAKDGYRTVVVQTGAQGLTSNFQVYTPVPPTPYISYYWPSSGLPGQTFTISFAGSNTHWDPNPTTGTQATFGSGITVNTFQVTSPTSAIANITITASHAQSNLIVFTTGSETESAGFNVVVSVPTLSIVDPGSALQGAQNVVVNIIGQFTTFDNTTSFSFGPGITVNGPPTILGPTIATQSISVDQLATLGGRSVVATTQGVQVSGAGFSVTPSLALISAITPNTAPQGSTITVDVTGQNTHWNPATHFSFGAGIVVTSTTVNSATDATLTLALPALAPIGPTGASAQTLGEVANINNGFVVQVGTPLLLSSGPGSVPQQGSAVFTILGQATHWLANPPTVDFGLGVTITHVSVTGDSTLTVNGYVQPTTDLGYRTLTVSTGTQILTLPYAMYVSPGPAVVNSVTPATGGQSVNLPAVQINGINTHWQQGVTLLNFPNVLVNSFTVNSPTSITANITVNINAPAGQVNVTTTTLGEVATKVNAFTITQTQPELLAAVSNTGTQGQSENVTITGAFTHFVNGTSTASFGTGIAVNSVTVNSATQIVANITVQPTTALGYRNVSVTTGAEVVALTNGFQVTRGPAAILSLSPSSGGQNNSYVIQVTGSQTNFASGVTSAAFGGGISVTGITVVDALHAKVNITIPSSTPLAAYDVSLTTGGEVATILGGFTVNGGSPHLSVVNPPTGTQGTSNVNVTLTGLFTNFVNGASHASFGAGITVNSTTVSSSTSAVANITISPTATLGSRTVTVTTNAETASITGGFTVLTGVPALLTALPVSAQAGSTANVVVTGQFTNFQQGISTVSFGSGITVNVVTVSSLTQLTANVTVAANATVGSRDITVTTNSETVTLNSGFSVTPGTPIITQINPNIGAPGATVNVTLTGQYTNWGATTKASFGPEVSVGGAAAGVAGPVVVANPTTLTATIAVAPGAAVGPQDVVVTTGAEVEHIPGGFTVQAPAITPPTVITFSPGANAGGMPINSNIIAVFSQPMDRTTLTTATVKMYLTTNPSGWVLVPGAVNLDATGRVLTFVPSSLLAVNSQYYFQMNGGIKDAAGNAFGQYTVYLYTTFSANTTPPAVVLTNPRAGSTGVGTNVAVQLQFSADMDQSTVSGVTVKHGATPVAGTFAWNSQATCCWGPGNILTFTPTAPLSPSTTYTVSYASPLADTAGNVVTTGAFSFTTGSGTDTASNYASIDFVNYQTNVGTNFVPKILFTKPVNPLNINTSSLLMYNADSGKYILGTVSLASDAKSATFAPSAPLLPNAYYRVHMSSGTSYDIDGNYLYGVDGYFTTGAGTDLVPIQVKSVFPANASTSVPINAQVVVHFNEPMDPAIFNVIRVTPTGGGAALAGTTTVGADQMTLTFVPNALLKGNTQFTIQVSGYKDLVGNIGSTSTSTFTTSTTVAPVILSTGLDASGNLITANNTNDGHWVVVPNGSSTAQPLQVVGPGDTGWYNYWLANGPGSDWVAINPNSTTGNTLGTYSTTFNLTGYSLTNLCLVGGVGIDDYGTLLLNGNAITAQIGSSGSLYPLMIPLPVGDLNAGLNTLSLQWGTTDNSYEAFRLQASIQTCGASFTGGLSLVSSTPTSASTGVSTNSTITLNFNHPLDPATVSSSTLPVMIGWNSNQILAGTYQVTGSQVIFTPDSPFPINTSIYVGNCNGPYDTAGDTYPGCYGLQWLQFTTGSVVTPPATSFQVVAFSPAFGATNVGLRAPVTATFNRSLNPGTVNSGAGIDFALFTGDSQSPTCTSYSRSQDNSSIQFNCYPLPSSSVMTAYLNSGIQDWSGNPLANYSSQFTTTYYDSNFNGTIISSRPGNASSGIDANAPLVLFSNLPINPAGASNGIQVAQNNAALTGNVQVLDNGYTLVFTPSTPFTPGALIQWWTNGGLTDVTYGTQINSASGYFYVAGDTSTLVPAVQVVSPAAYTSTIPINTEFDIQFNTPLDPATVNSSNIYLYDSSTGLHVAGTYSMPQPNVVRIVPASNLSASTYIYTYLTAGLHSSTSVPATATSWYNYTGTTTDTSLPNVLSAVPFNGAGNVGVNVQPGVVFSKAIDPVSINSSSFQVTHGGTPLAGSYWFSSNDTRVQFVPNAPLPSSANLVIKLTNVLDQQGHAVNFTSNFLTGPGPDFNQPTVVWTSVTSNESIPTNSAITIQFSESMDVTTFNTGNIRIYDTLLGTNVAATLSWSADQSVAYLVPTAPLAAGRQYYLYVTGGTDLAGNGVQGVVLYFYADFTGASVAPGVVQFNPLNGATGVGTNVLIQAQFTAHLDPNTLGGVVLSTGGTPVAATPSLIAGNSVLQVLPNAPLAPNTTYLLTIAGVKDPAGNLVATVTNSFTTGSTFDLGAPTAVTYAPANNSTVGTNVAPKIVFNKPLNPITVSNSTFRMFLADTGQFVPLTLSLSSNGMQVTLVPVSPLLPNTRYHFQACCGFQDQNGNNGNQLDIYFYTSSGTDVAGPTVAITPGSGATGIPLNSIITANISEQIDPLSWNQTSIRLLDNLNHAVAGTVTQPNNQTLLFTPASPLLPNITYSVKVGGFWDAVGNPVVPLNSTFTTGSTTSGGGLTLVSTNIPLGATGVSATQPIILTFSQILNPTSVNSNTLLVMNSWNSNYGLAGTYTVSGNQVTFTPTSPYPAGATIYMGECGGPTDVLGDVFLNGGCYNQQIVYFTVVTGSPDTSALQVLSVNPANGATGVRPDMSVSVTFNKSINPYSVYSNGNNALLFAGQSLFDRGSITMSADDRTMTFNAGTLPVGTNFTISLPAGGITDPSGNSLTNLFTSTFTTGYNPATGNGTVNNVSPTFNATGVATDTLLTLFLNRPVDPTTLAGNLIVTVNGQVYAGTIHSLASDFEVQYTPSVPFPSGAVVQWFFSNVRDIYSDVFTGNSGTFYIQPTAHPSTDAPVIVAVSPSYGSGNVPTNAVVDLLFSLPIDGTTLAGNVYFNGNLPVTITQPSPKLVRLTPTAPFAPATTYYVCANSSVKGTNGVAAQSSCWTTYFTTNSGPDVTSGTVTVGPPDASVNVGTNAYIRLVFSKPVDRTSVNPTTAQVSNGGSAVHGSWSFVYSGNDAIGANFTPENGLPPSSNIQVSLNGLLDYAGNLFNSSTTQFTTAAMPDYATPTVTLDFAYGQTGVATNAIFNCRYSQPMDPSSITAGNTYIYSYAGGTHVPVTYSVSPDLLTATLTPTASLAANAQFYYTCGGAIDLTGNGQYNSTAVFYTGSGPSVTGPVLIQSNPPNAMTNVPINTNNGPWNSTSLGLLFSEPIALNSLGNITLTPNGGSPIPIGVSLNNGNTEVAVILPWSLKANTTYTYNISGVQDYNGNPMTPVTRTFTTGSSFAWANPTVTAASPLNGATGVNTATPAVSLTFSTAMNPILIDTGHIYLRNHNTSVVVPATITISADYKTVQVTPTAPLTAATIYDLVTSNPNWYLTDIAGNPFYAPGVVSTFTTQ